MVKWISMLMLLAATAIAQETNEDYNTYFGIKYSPDGYKSLQFIQYPYGSFFGVTEKTSTLNFTSIFGKKVAPGTFILLDLSFTRDKFTIDNQDMGLTMITPSIGIKKIIKKTDRVKPYLTAGIAKTIAMASIEDADAESEEILEDINSPFIINGGFGIEYFFNPQFSMVMDANLIYQYHSGKIIVEDDEGDDYLAKIKYSNLFKRVSVGFNMYF